MKPSWVIVHSTERFGPFEDLHHDALDYLAIYDLQDGIVDDRHANAPSLENLG